MPRKTRWLIVMLLLVLAGCSAPGSEHGSSLFGGMPMAGYGAGLGSGGGSGDRYSPTPGVVCDRGQQVCYDRNGPDVGLTREYFGRDSASSLKDQVGDHSHRDPYYSPDKGVRCDLGDQLCAKRGTPSYTQTRQQFGRKPALAVQEPDGTIVPKKNVACDPSSQVCTKNGEPNVDATRYVFGKKAAKSVKKSKQDEDD